MLLALLSGFLAGRNSFSFPPTDMPRCGDGHIIENKTRRASRPFLNLEEVEEWTYKQNSNSPKSVITALKITNGFIVLCDNMLIGMLKEPLGF